MKFSTQAVLVVASLQAVACLRADVELSGTTGESETTGEMSSESTNVAGGCGDGVVDEGEGCDDGNKEDGDGCPSGENGRCVAAGGFVWGGVEECDDGNGEDVDGCNNDCAAPRWVFITSTNGPNNDGDLGGIDGADAHCQSLADGAGLGGVYMAWLTGSDPDKAPAMRFASTAYAGWYVLPTEPPTGVARGWVDLTGANEGMPENYLQAAIVVDENGINIGDANAWTNTKFDGTSQGDDHCDEWKSGSSNHLGYTGHSKGDILSDDWIGRQMVPAKMATQVRVRTVV